MAVSLGTNLGFLSSTDLFKLGYTFYLDRFDWLDSCLILNRLGGDINF